MFNRIKCRSELIVVIILFIHTGCKKDPGRYDGLSERFTNSIGMEMVLVKPHDREKAPRFKPFYISATEVTNQQFERFMLGHRDYRDSCSSDDNQPVVYVSYYDAEEFAEWLSDKEERKYRIPKEEEWIYAATGGNEDLLYSTSTGELSHNLANILGTGQRDTFLLTAPVASFPPNKSVIYDMTGNVWEWCDSWYIEKRTIHRIWLKPKWNHDIEIPFIWYTKPKKWRVVKGGSYLHSGANQRITLRNAYKPDTRESSYGFRVVMRIK